MTAGRQAYPPTDTTTRGRSRRSRRMASRLAARSFGTIVTLTARSRRDIPRCSPTTSRNVCGNGLSASNDVSIPRSAPT